MKYTKKFFLNDYMLPILHKNGIKRQFVSSLDEIRDSGYNDPLNEADFSKTKGLIHRYPDRVVLTVTNRCFAYCRFCFRKKNWFEFEGFDLSSSVEYIKQHRSIREVLVSGGDALFLSNKRLYEILSSIKNIKHINIIRIGTRVFSSNPKRINNGLINILKSSKPIWIAAHINHIDEITIQFENAVRKVIDSGVPIVAQTVLLKGINDNAYTLEKLFCKLVSLGIKPYYLFGCDQALGNEHFRVSIPKALSIIDKLRGRISGLCVPSFSFDLPMGGGKIVLEPNRIVKKGENRYTFLNFEGKEYEYVDI